MEKRLSRVEREKIEIERTILQHAENLFKLNGYITTQCTTKNKTENSEPTYIKRLLIETIGSALLLDC